MSLCGLVSPPRQKEAAVTVALVGWKYREGEDSSRQIDGQREGDKGPCHAVEREQFSAESVLVYVRDTC